MPRTLPVEENGVLKRQRRFISIILISLRVFFCFLMRLTEGISNKVLSSRKANRGNEKTNRSVYLTYVLFVMKKVYPGRQSNPHDFGVRRQVYHLTTKCIN
uniref:Uncharacterized protein n=1 Tax=Cacopsylla melanoneura TaxID=428564 RepID=A0A8D8XW29_9HEMI